jgi:tetratricopeptide (TPR) repeat protein
MAVTLVEPLHVGVTPLAALALGAAGSGVALRPVRRGAVVVAAAVVALGAVVSVGLLTGLADLRRGSVDDTAGVAEAAARRLPPWGRPAAEAGTVVAFDGIASGSASDQASALRWWALAARQDPADPAGWNDLAGALDAAGQPAAAATAYRRALADNPWSLLALRGLVRVGPAAGVAPSELAAAEDRLARLDRNRA